MIISQILKVGYELNEIRRGYGLEYRLSNNTKPTGTIQSIQKEARHVLTKLFFDQRERAEMSSRLEAVKQALSATWDEGNEGRPKGRARHDLESFIQTYLLV